jgi:hypothetical protein
MVKRTLASLSQQEETALRRLGAGARWGQIDISLAMARRFLRLGLAERAARTWRLTPLGRQRLSALPKAFLQTKARQIIENILEHYIPLAQAGGLPRQGDTANDESQPKPCRAKTHLSRAVGCRRDLAADHGDGVVESVQRIGDDGRLVRVPGLRKNHL